MARFRFDLEPDRSYPLARDFRIALALDLPYRPLNAPALRENIVRGGGSLIFEKSLDEFR